MEGANPTAPMTTRLAVCWDPVMDSRTAKNIKIGCVCVRHNKATVVAWYEKATVVAWYEKAMVVAWYEKAMVVAWYEKATVVAHSHPLIGQALTPIL